MSNDSLPPPPPPQPTPKPPPQATNPPPPPSTIKPRPPPSTAKLPTHDPNLHQYRPKFTPKKRIPTTHKRPCFSFCCCFMWFLIVLFILAAAVAAATGVFWLLFKPQRPRFTIASLMFSSLNLTGNLDTDGTGHLFTSGNLTISAKNPNSKIGTFYDSISMSTYSRRGVLIANSAFRSFESAPENSTVLRFVFINDRVLDLDAARGMRSDLGGRSEMKGRVVLETKMGVEIGKWRSKRIGIVVLCQGLTVKVPKKVTIRRNGLAPGPAAAPAMAMASTAAEAAALTDDGSCKVNLSIKFWGFVF